MLALISPRLTVSRARMIKSRSRTGTLLMFTLTPRWRPAEWTEGGETGQPGVSAPPPVMEEVRGERDTVTARSQLEEESSVVRRESRAGSVTASPVNTVLSDITSSCF